MPTNLAEARREKRGWGRQRSLETELLEIIIALPHQCKPAAPSLAVVLRLGGSVKDKSTPIGIARLLSATWGPTMSGNACMADCREGCLLLFRTQVQKANRSR